MAGVMITASKTPCSLTPSCDGTVQRPQIKCDMPVAFSPAKVSLTLSLPPSPPSQAVSRSTRSAHLAKHHVPFQNSKSQCRAWVSALPLYLSIYNVIIHNIMNNKNISYIPQRIMINCTRKYMYYTAAVGHISLTDTIQKIRQSSLRYWRLLATLRPSSEWGRNLDKPHPSDRSPST